MYFLIASVLGAIAAIFLSARGMLPMQAVRLQLGALLAADPTTLAPAASANMIVLIAAAFVLEENQTLAGLTLATFTGSGPIAGVVGIQEVGLNPVTGQQVVQIESPLGGYRWIATNTVNLPQTIYGYALTNNAGSVLLGLALLPTPITLTTPGQFIDIDPVYMSIVTQPIS